MPRKWSKAVPKGNGPVPHHDQFGSQKPTMVDLNRTFEVKIDRMDKNLDRMSELTGMLRATNQHSAGLPHEARQPRLATETDVEPDTKTRKRTGDFAADRVTNGNSSSAGVNDGPTFLTSFGMIAQPPTPETLKHQSRASHPWRCARQQSLVVYCPSAQTLQQWEPYFPDAFFLEPRLRDEGENRPDKLQPACPSFLEESLRNEIKAKSGV